MVGSTIPEEIDIDRIAGLIDHRNEEPEVEYKTWMDLTSSENKSKIAKHLCALANYGGGWLVFGIDRNGFPAEPHPEDLSGYNQDLLNSIVDRYLHPAFHCRVHFATSRQTKRIYPVVQIPPHGPQPVCAKSDGPLVDKRRIGVSQGVHYIRVSGPKSVAIDRPELWQQLLHRCVVRERDSLIASISRLFDAPIAVSRTPSLDIFADSGIARWNELQGEGWPVDPKLNRTCFAFQLLTGNDSVPELELSKLKDAIREASNAVESECHAVGTFDFSLGGTLAPKVIVTDEVEGYESNAIRDREEYLFAPSHWRALANGIGAEVRPFHEDTNWLREAMQQRSSRAWISGAHLSPRLQAVRAYEFVTFVRHFSTAFDNTESVMLLADYAGLSERTIRDTGGYYSLDRKSGSGGRRFKVKTSIESLSGEGASRAVTLLINPVLRLFDGWEVRPEFVQKAVHELS